MRRLATEARLATKLQRAATEHAEDFTRADDAIHKALAELRGVIAALAQVKGYPL